MSHENHDHATVLFTQEYWDERYAAAERIWSGNANPQLVATVGELTPGTALDVGSGEGADAIWLAAQGWQVTGVDVSAVALTRAAQQAAQAGAGIADRITWQRADAHSFDPAPQQFDLVSAQFMYLPQPALQALHRRLAAAVRPGGTLLIVGHHPADHEAMGRPQHLVELMYTADQVATVLDPEHWQITVTAPAREIKDADGKQLTIHDTVLLAVRR